MRVFASTPYQIPAMTSVESAQYRYALLPPAASETTKIIFANAIAVAQNDAMLKLL